jgi:sugar phosphate isomerase/epimerase
VRCAISTHLYHDERLTRDHLSEIASLGFEAIELFAVRNHFPYDDPAAIARLGGWLRETGLALHAVHAPIAETLVSGRWGPSFSTASSNPAERERAVREAVATLDLAGELGAGHVVVHLGLPSGQKPAASDNDREGARRSLEQIVERRSSTRVNLAIEVIPNAISAPAALVRLIEEDVDLEGVGICLDFGHAFLVGDVVDAIETISGHLLTTHVHDNHGRDDEHLVPYEGGIDWPAALTAMQKIGYDGVFVMELAASASPRAVLERTRRAREAFDRILAIEAAPGGQEA